MKEKKREERRELRAEMKRAKLQYKIKLEENHVNNLKAWNEENDRPVK